MLAFVGCAKPHSSWAERPMSELGRVSRTRRLSLAVRSCTRDEGGLRGQQSGAGLKSLQAAIVKSDCGERCRNVGTRSRQTRLREANASDRR
jgi:hypothetical protein